MSNESRNYKSRNGQNSDYLQQCLLCHGTGQLSADIDNADRSASEEATCPLCQGSGKARYTRNPLLLRPRYGHKMMSLRRPRPARGGKPSLTEVRLLTPGTPLSSYEGDMIPGSEEPSTPPEELLHFDIDADPSDLDLTVEIPFAENSLEPNPTADSSCTAEPTGVQPLQPVHPLDITGISDPTGFDVNTGVIGADRDINADIIGDVGSKLGTPGPQFIGSPNGERA